MPLLASVSTLRPGWACRRDPATASPVGAAVCAGLLPLTPDRRVGGDEGVIPAVGGGTTTVRHEKH